MMCGGIVTSDDQDTSKLAKYLELIAARVLKPLESPAVQESCCTTLMLVFAAVDALGGLIHPEEDAGNADRSREFLRRFMGVEYARRFKELWKLRNALVHNAVNVECYLSSTELQGWAHLKRIGGTGLIYVNTGFASRDLLDGFRRLTAWFATDAAAAARAAGRLEWADDTQKPVGQEPQPTQAAPFHYLYVPGRGGRDKRRKHSRRGGLGHWDVAK